MVSPDCVGLQSLVEVPLDRVTGRLPPGFEPLARESGQATLVVTARSCEQLGLANAQGELGWPAVTWSDVGVLVEPVSGLPGVQEYIFWSATNDTTFFPLLQAAGLPVSLSNESLSWSWVAQPAAGAWTAFVNADPGEATVTALFGNSPLLPGTTHPLQVWHVSKGALVHIDYGIEPLVGAAGYTASTIAAPPGSQLAQILGATMVPAQSSVLFFHVDAEVSAA